MKRWMKGSAVVIALFVIVFLWIRSAEADTLFEVAPATTYIGGNHYEGAGLTFTERFDGKYDLGLSLMSEHSCGCDRGDKPGNLGLHAERVVQWRALELGIGAAYWHNQTAWSSNVTFALHWGLNFGSWTVRHRHYSTGGTSGNNAGLDLLMFGYRFD